jgi:hypothetical protein
MSSRYSSRYIEDYLNDACDSHTPAGMTHHHYFQPGITLALSTLGCCVILLVNRHIENKKLTTDPRIQLEQLVMSASTLPRELQVK